MYQTIICWIFCFLELLYLFCFFPSLSGIFVILISLLLSFVFAFSESLEIFTFLVNWPEFKSLRSFLNFPTNFCKVVIGLGFFGQCLLHCASLFLELWLETCKQHVQYIWVWLVCRKLLWWRFLVSCVCPVKIVICCICSCQFLYCINYTIHKSIYDTLSFHTLCVRICTVYHVSHP